MYPNVMGIVPCDPTADLREDEVIEETNEYEFEIHYTVQSKKSNKIVTVFGKTQMDALCNAEILYDQSDILGIVPCEPIAV
ncbi:hypothetical protein D1872_309770 [compost metagenome]